MTYCGRFAPSPTGRLHFGSLVAAVASYADARAHAGRWLLRMEDVDRTREVQGAADDILRTLDVFGFAWSGEVVYQSRRTALYERAIDRLRAAGAAYPCGCSRSAIAAAGRAGPEGPIYPGTCRYGMPPGGRERAVRVLTDDTPVVLHDAICGEVGQRIESEVGDFVVRRADGCFAYQLAVVVDDAEQGVTDVVRGGDLLGSTPRQVHLQRLLGLPTPRYAHVPLVLGADGRKLSKQDRSRPVDRGAPLQALRAAWAFLGQSGTDAAQTPEEFWQLATLAWDLSKVPASKPPPAVVEARPPP
jgi:glutamyl-Q tRNA(Asp) synthetase